MGIHSYVGRYFHVCSQCNLWGSCSLQTNHVAGYSPTDWVQHLWSGRGVGLLVSG